MSIRFSLFSVLATILFLASSADAATFVVDRADDGGGIVWNACTNAPNDCSLRGAILNANLNGPGADTINFDIPGGGVHTINISAGSLSIHSSLTINGATQSGYFGKPMIELKGGGNTSFGLLIGSNDTISVNIFGLAINGFYSAGIQSECTGTCNINLYGNFIGTDPSGELAVGNGGDGIKIKPSQNSVINVGGPGVFEGNVVSGNDGTGIHIPRGPVLNTPNVGGSQVNISGNKVGTDFDGQTDLGNGEEGVEVISILNGIDVPVTLTLGGSTASARNVISGNFRNGVSLLVPSATVRGNRIGTDVSGSYGIHNGQNGIFINAYKNNNYVIGGIGAGEGNVVSGNHRHGIQIFTSHETEISTANVAIQGNFIGTDTTGTLAVKNTSSGIFVEGNIPGTPYEPSAVTVNTIIGGLATSARNVISGNGGSGVLIGSGDISLYRNHIGTNAAGTSALGNEGYGISVYDATKVTIGGTLLSDGTPVDTGNLISGNGGSIQGGDGIRIWGLHSGQTFIRRNRIGTNVNGTGAIPNLGNGIRVDNTGTVIGSDAIADDGNIISGNISSGISIAGFQQNAKLTKIYGNKIGSNGIGGSPLPNGGHGISITDSPNNFVGLGAIGSRSNVIASNGGSGIWIAGSASTGNRIEGNYIGTGPVLNDLGNQGDGIRFVGFSSGNYVGGSNGSGNVIAFNSAGVYVFNGNDNEIRANSIFSNDALGIDLGAVGITPNDPGDGDTGANRLQNFPVLNRATPAAISGTLNSTPGGLFTIDLFRVDSCDASGHGEGRYYLGSMFIQTNALTGDASFEFPASLAVGQVVTATATVTDVFSANDTSEFSQCKVVTPSPTFSFSNANYSISEAAASRTIIVTRSGASDGIATVDFATSDGTATAGQDYTPISGTLTFGDGEIIKSFDVAILSDTLDEDDETINLTLSNPTGGATLVTPSTAVLTIQDNDDPPTILIADHSANEGDSGITSFEFAVSLSAASGRQITVNYATADGTAAAGSDYNATNGNVAFAPGETQKTITISVIGDTVVEPDETFVVNLTNPVNTTITDGQAVGTILNDDIAFSIGGTVRDSSDAPLAGISIQISGSHTGQTTTDSNGRYGFDGLSNDGDFTITPSASGMQFTPQARNYYGLSENISNADFVGAVEIARSVDIISGFATPGQSGGVVISLVAASNENSVALSLEYDATLLSDPQVTLKPDAQNAILITDTSVPDHIGITISLPPGQTFAAGGLNLAFVSFTAALTNVGGTPINVVNTPVVLAVADSDGNLLPSGHSSGFVFFSQGYESDVSPRPTGTGDGSVDADDLFQIGRFIAKLDTPTLMVNEFQRADSAPRATFGNGKLTAADLAQAARYAAGLDPSTPAAGAVVQSSFTDRLFDGAKFGPSTVRIVGGQTSPGAQIVVKVEVDADGTENAMSFTLNYDATRIAPAFAEPGTDAQAGMIFANTSVPGTIGVVIGLPGGQALAAGTQHVLSIRFNVAANAPAGQTPVTFGSVPVPMEVADSQADAKATVFENGFVNILGPTSASVIVGGRVLTSDGRPINRAAVKLTDMNGAVRQTLTNQFGYYRFTGVTVANLYQLEGSHKRYQFTPVTVAVMDDILDANLIANP
jgi:hypothetical protein